MIVKILFEFETDLREFRGWSVQSENGDFTVEHSGSSYYRIMQNGKQVGTVGGHCPESACNHQNHISISLDKKK